MTWISSPDRLVIGNDVYVGKLCTICGTGTIGNGTLIANKVGVGVGSKGAFRDTRSQIDVGSDVWIGFGSTILGGVCIGRGAIVAAGSVVVENVSPYDIVRGNPAKSVGRRFTDDQIAAHEAAIANYYNEDT
jgi:acetyltransferase-like isoleucine patch superfamily enzyme